MKRSLVFDDGSSKKFWDVSAQGTMLTVTFGRIGTAGQTQSRTLASPEACAKEADALLRSKLKKGYVDTSGVKSSPAKSSPVKASPTKAAPRKKLSSGDAKALLRAIELGLAPKVKAALAGQPDVNVQIAVGSGVKTTPLLMASERDNAQIVALLLDAGAVTTDADYHGRTPLMLARQVEVARRLLDAGADVKAADKHGRTALHHACQTGDADMAVLLLDRGAELEARDAEGKTPYVLASKRPLRELLKQRGARGLDKSDGRALKPKSRKASAEDVDVEGGALGIDSAGRVWVGGSSAIFCIEGERVKSFEFEESFSVDQIAPGPAGTMYFSTNWGLVTRVGEAWRLYSAEDSEIHESHLTSLTVDRLGRAHVMGYGEEEEVDRPISIFDGKGFTVLTAGHGLPRGLETKCLAFDAKNALVFGTNADTLTIDGDIVWSGDSSGVRRREGSGKSKSFPTEDGVNCACLDQHALWVGLSYGGLLHIDGAKTRAFTDENSGLAETDVRGLSMAPDGTLWIAAGGAVFTLRGGVVRPLAGGDQEPAPQDGEHDEDAPKRELMRLPARPFVAEEKVPRHVLDAVRAARLESLPPEALLRFLRPAIGVVLGKATSAAVGASKLGGRVDLAPGAGWPTFEDEDDRCLPFLLQVNLADVAAYDLEGLLPKEGLVAFFAETVPDQLDAAQVTFTDAGKKVQRLDWPGDLVDRKTQRDFVAQLPECALTFYSTWTLPTARYLSAYAELTEADATTLQALDTAIHARDPGGSSETRLLGWPQCLQDEVVDAPDQIVLLQLDAGMKAPRELAQVFRQWGEGLVHFVIAQRDLEKKKLSNAEALLAYT